MIRLQCGFPVRWTKYPIYSCRLCFRVAVIARLVPTFVLCVIAEAASAPVSLRRHPAVHRCRRPWINPSWSISVLSLQGYALNSTKIFLFEFVSARPAVEILIGVVGTIIAVPGWSPLILALPHSLSLPPYFFIRFKPFLAWLPVPAVARCIADR